MRQQRRRRGGGVLGRSRTRYEPSDGGNGSAVPIEPDEPLRGSGAAVPLQPLGGNAGNGGSNGGDGGRTAAGATAAGPVVAPRPRIAGPLEAFLSHPFLTLLPLIALIGAAIALGMERDPEYTAYARITVGNTDVNPFLLQEVVAGNQALAASYARAIEAEPVTRTAAGEIGISPATAAERLSATPIVQSTLIQVQATGPSTAASTALANAGADALIDYVRRVNQTNDADELFEEYQRAQAAARRAERRTQRLLSDRRRNQSRAATEARIEQDLAALKASDLENRYRAASQSASAASRLVLIQPAADADSDRRDVLEQLLIAGAIGGLVLGLGLALLRANWPILRALRRT